MQGTKICKTQETRSLEEFFNGNLNKVFLYITERCNLECPFCLMGDPEGKDFSLEDISRILDWTKAAGAYDLTLIGGEPTVHRDLLAIIQLAKEKNFKIIAMDSNGSFDISFFENPAFTGLDKLCVSLDAPDSTNHDLSRGMPGLYDIAIRNIKKSVELGMYTKVTFTATKNNAGFASQMVRLAAELNIDELNFHLVSRTGRALYNQDVIPDPQTWIDNCYAALALRKKIAPDLKLRIPLQFVDAAELDTIKEHSCVSWDADRVLFFPNGNIYSCSMLIGSEHTLGKYDNGVFTLNTAKNSEICRYHENKTPRDVFCRDVCPVQKDPESPHYVDDSKLVPLCVSYKPAGGIKVE